MEQPDRGSSSTAPQRRRGWPRARAALPGVGALAWFAAVGLALLAPALTRGSELGPYDLLRVFGLGAAAGPAPHNIVDSDQIQQVLPWTSLVWHQVHSGHLPLWNPSSAMGMPLAFNFQSAPFSLPSLVGYLVPVRFAFDAAIGVKLVVAGSGTYALCRVLRTGLLPAVFAGTVFELSGSFSGWLGWPLANVFCLTGWLFAAAILVIRSPRPRQVALLALAVALAVYGGHPESILILLLCLGLFASLVVLRPLVGRAPGEGRTVCRAVAVRLGALGAGVLGGAGLSAPLWLPGLQLAAGSARTAQAPYQALPAGALIGLGFQRFDGLPIAGNHYFSTANYYTEASYVGLAALVLALVGLVRVRRRGEVLALALVGLACACVAYFGPFDHLLDHLPGASGVLWDYALVPLDFALAALAGIGLHHVMGAGGRSQVVRLFGWTWGAAALAMAALFVWFVVDERHLLPADAHQRLWSFAWPAGQVAAGLVATAALWRQGAHRPRHRRSPVPTPTHPPVPSRTRSSARLAAGLLLAVETGFLVWAGAPLWSSQSTSFVPTPAERSLQRLVGSARVGFGSCRSLVHFPDLGILPDANVAYGIDELAVYDAILPLGYYRAWAQTTGQPQPPDAAGNFCPSLTTASEARLYGVSYLLESPDAPGPPGTRRVAVVGGEGLYRVVGAAIATVVADRRLAHPPAVETPARIAMTGPTVWRVDLDDARRTRLHLRLTDVPGWTASIGGRQVPLQSWHQIMLQAEVPAGRHQLVLRYQPRPFAVGAVLALVTLALLGTWGALGWWISRPRPRRRSSRGSSDPPSGPPPGSFRTN